MERLGRVATAGAEAVVPPKSVMFFFAFVVAGIFGGVPVLIGEARPTGGVFNAAARDDGFVAGGVLKAVARVALLFLEAFLAYVRASGTD